MSKDIVKKSKYLSLLLRHKPEKENLTMDKNGWVLVSEILDKLNLTKEQLDTVVEENNKKRFEYDDNEERIRARQGHSINVDVELKTKVPPTELYHGTNMLAEGMIRQHGIKKMNRNHVHLSEELATAINVGSRKGSTVIVLTIDAQSMFADGYDFYLSNNGVWLTDHVPTKYIKDGE
jgi:putative RNA 2'-phosphotransferase